MWTASSEFGTYRLCEQRRFRRACASAQSRQNLLCSLIQAVSQEEPSDRKPDPWPLWIAGHAQLKFVMTECSKTQIRLTGLMLCLILFSHDDKSENSNLLARRKCFQWKWLPCVNQYLFSHGIFSYYSKVVAFPKQVVITMSSINDLIQESTSVCHIQREHFSCIPYQHF